MVTALLSILLACGALWLAWRIMRAPRPVVRRLVYLLVRTLYRLRLTGLEHLPRRGAALVVCNHVSFMDALVVGASPRPLRFLMGQADL